MKKYFKNRKNNIKRLYFKKDTNINKRIVFSYNKLIFFRRNKYFLFKKYYRKLTKKRFLKAYVFLKVNFKMFKKSKNSRMGKGKGSFNR